MTNHLSNLPDLLDRLAEEAAVGPAPVSTMVATARRTRRRRTVATLGGSALAVAAVIIGVGQASRLPGPAGGGQREDIHVPTSTVEPVPNGFRLVGLGRAGILVPDTWVATGSQWRAPGSPDGVTMTQGSAPSGSPPETGQLVAGMPALVTAPTCGQEGDGTGCRGSVWLTTEQVGFTATSGTAEGVQEILGGIRALSAQQVGVPESADLVARSGSDAALLYGDRLLRLGLRPRYVDVVQAGGVADSIVSVDPPVSTLVPTGAVVSVGRVVGDVSADPFRVTVDWTRLGEDQSPLDDPQVRVGGRLYLALGDVVRAHATGVHGAALTAALAGDSLAQGRSLLFSAVRPGTATITLSTVVDGHRVLVGTVGVLVQ